MWIHLVIAVTVIVLATLFFTRLGENLWLSITESEYQIPKESNVFAFSPIVMKSGANDWWIYGEDRKHYYYFTGAEDQPYQILDKSHVLDCRTFNPVDVTTWYL